MFLVLFLKYRESASKALHLLTMIECGSVIVGVESAILAYGLAKDWQLWSAGAKDCPFRDKNKDISDYHAPFKKCAEHIEREFLEERKTVRELFEHLPNDLMETAQGDTILELVSEIYIHALNRVAAYYENHGNEKFRCILKVKGLSDI